MGRQRLPVGSDESEQEQIDTKPGQPVDPIPTTDIESRDSQPIEESPSAPAPTDPEQSQTSLSPERIDLAFELQGNGEEPPSHWLVVASCGWFKTIGLPRRRRRPGRERAKAGHAHR
jgi:hypothetical protein